MTTPAPTPTLRCLSCGYDIASLVEQRGRDEPGVCPECAMDNLASLREYESLGHPYFRRNRARDFVAFLRDSLLHPRQTALRIPSKRSDEAPAFWLSIAIMFVLSMLISTIHGYATAGAEGAVSGVGKGISGGISTTIQQLLLMLLVGSCFGTSGERGKIAFSAMNVGAVWVIILPIAAIPAVIVTGGTITSWADAVWALPPAATIALSLVWTGIAARAISASKRPPPLNLESP